MYPAGPNVKRIWYGDLITVVCPRSKIWNTLYVESYTLGAMTFRTVRSNDLQHKGGYIRRNTWCSRFRKRERYAQARDLLVSRRLWHQYRADKKK